MLSGSKCDSVWSGAGCPSRSVWEGDSIEVNQKGGENQLCDGRYLHSQPSQQHFLACVMCGLPRTTGGSGKGGGGKTKVSRRGASAPASKATGWKRKAEGGGGKGRRENGSEVRVGEEHHGGGGERQLLPFEERELLSQLRYEHACANGTEGCGGEQRETAMSVGEGGEGKREREERGLETPPRQWAREDLDAWLSHPDQVATIRTLHVPLRPLNIPHASLD